MWTRAEVAELGVLSKRVGWSLDILHFFRPRSLWQEPRTFHFMPRPRLNADKLVFICALLFLEDGKHNLCRFSKIAVVFLQYNLFEP